VDEYIENLKKVFQKRELHWAIVVEEPLLAAFTSLVQYNRFFKNRVRVFSTIAAAVNFLNVAFSESDLQADGFIPVYRST
jgi:predicted membrane-bound mannosyltransferase